MQLALSSNAAAGKRPALQTTIRNDFAAGNKLETHCQSGCLMRLKCVHYGMDLLANDFFHGLRIISFATISLWVFKKRLMVIISIDRINFNHVSPLSHRRYTLWNEW